MLFLHSQFSSLVQSCPTLCDPMDCSTKGFPVHHLLPEFAQNHVHRVGDAIQPSNPLLSPSPPAFNLSKHQFSQFSSVSSMPGLPVYHQLLELAQTHVHQVSDAIQSSHPLLSPSPPAFNLSQHQGLF